MLGVPNRVDPWGKDGDHDGATRVRCCRSAWKRWRDHRVTVGCVGRPRPARVLSREQHNDSGQVRGNEEVCLQRKLDKPAEFGDRAHPSVTCQLALGARSGEPGRFDALYARLSPSLLAWARMPLHRHLRASMDADDFVQDVWIRATRHFDSFDPARGTFRQWIFKIAKNMSIDVLRQYGRAKDRGAPDARGGSSVHELGAKSTGEPSTWLQVAHTEAFETFLQRVGSMPHDEQVLLVQCGIEEQPIAQVAARLEITEAAAHKRWQRLRARLVAERMPEGIIE